MHAATLDPSGVFIGRAGSGPLSPGNAKPHFAPPLRSIVRRVCRKPCEDHCNRHRDRRPRLEHTRDTRWLCGRQDPEPVDFRQRAHGQTKSTPERYEESSACVASDGALPEPVENHVSTASSNMSKCLSSDRNYANTGLNARKIVFGIKGLHKAPRQRCVKQFPCHITAKHLGIPHRRFPGARHAVDRATPAATPAPFPTPHRG